MSWQFAQLFARRPLPNANLRKRLSRHTNRRNRCCRWPSPSTAQMRAFTARLARAQEMANSLDEFSDRDRLRKISLAAALANALFVTLHGESCDGHHWYRFEVRIILEPF